ncbi:Trp biosynthesis-associated membrane protein [Cellulomonas shaoxiangyii]|uniref:Trp biosynthesis protein n=1 Tax=Cellulomonas shaoxiangyii TaxID=2566013 RepID=A0A4P7SIU3_9CELL|nr:Trp biosynthesis-associated membrane protein [Cellulomonas shaoxiangyii]QCB93467.1 Trp biosynthesis protein [Cellulomonas shaoxiangyii]TGY86789.1 Trp biosynthesis protein [Cellulomonas shaoxiangyii]
MTAGPEGRGAAPRRGRWLALVVLAAAAVAASALPTWVTARAGTALEGDVVVRVPGTEAAPEVLAAAVALLASAGALALVGPVGRRVVAVVTAACGALVVAAALAVLRDPAGAATAAVAARTGVEPVAPDAGLTAGPVVTTALGVLVVVLALALLRARGAWRQRSRRHEVPRTPAAGAAAPGAAAGGAGPDDDDRADWDALSRGDDPS